MEQERNEPSAELAPSDELTDKVAEDLALTAAPAVIRALEAAHMPDQLASRLGGTVTLVADPSLALWAGHVAQTR